MHFEILYYNKSCFKINTKKNFKSSLEFIKLNKTPIFNAMKRRSAFLKLFFCFTFFIFTWRLHLLKNDLKQTFDVSNLKNSSRIGITSVQCSNNQKYLRFECLKDFCGGWGSLTFYFTNNNYIRILLFYSYI